MLVFLIFHESQRAFAALGGQDLVALVCESALTEGTNGILVLDK